jgi:hypothetical protein
MHRTVDEQWEAHRCSNCGVDHTGEPCELDDGYTLADLQRMREELREAWDKTIRDRQMRIMEQVGPDVYFHVLGPPTDQQPGGYR